MFMPNNLSSSKHFLTIARVLGKHEVSNQAFEAAPKA